MVLSCFFQAAYLHIYRLESDSDSTSALILTSNRAYGNGKWSSVLHSGLHSFVTNLLNSHKDTWLHRCLWKRHASPSIWQGNWGLKLQMHFMLGPMKSCSALFGTVSENQAKCVFLALWEHLLCESDDIQVMCMQLSLNEATLKMFEVAHSKIPHYYPAILKHFIMKNTFVSQFHAWLTVLSKIVCGVFLYSNWNLGSQGCIWIMY